MILPVVFLCLTAVLPPSTGEEPEGFDALSTSKASQQKLIVDRHNTLRRGVKPTASNMLKMEWCPPAAKNAQAWANQCTLSHSPGNMRRTTVQCGENLFMASAPFPWSDVIDAWYNEKEDFKYGTGAKTQGAVIGHYTQMVWYNSYQIGCAVAFCPNSKYEYFYVCQYCPMGNLLSSIPTPYKEGEPCGDCPNACDNGLCNGFPDFTCVSTCSAASACWTETTPCPSTFFENAEVFKSEHLTVKKEETHLTDVTKTPDDISPVRGREESASTAELCPPGAGLRYRPDVITGNAVLLLQEIPSTVRISAFNATVLSSKGKIMKELGWPIYM